MQSWKSFRTGQESQVFAHIFEGEITQKTSYTFCLETEISLRTLQESLQIWPEKLLKSYRILEIHKNFLQFS